MNFNRIAGNYMDRKFSSDVDSIYNEAQNLELLTLPNYFKRSNDMNKNNSSFW